MSRPEHIAPPELFYNESEAGKYTANSRIQAIQSAMARRCLELLNLPPDDGAPRLILDVGCGSGLSGDVLAEAGHGWVGLDISADMLEVAVERGTDGGDVLRSDAGQGFGFRPALFDGAISVSAIQWLCYSDKSEHRASRRLATFFASLYRCMRRGARAALQVYPERPEQLEMMTTAALKAGFHGGVVVDFPNSTKAKKYFLCLFAGSDPASATLPAAKQGDEAAAATTVAYESRRVMRASGKRKGGGGGGADRRPVKSRGWIVAKKESQRRRGDERVRPDSKYTGRKRAGFKV